ncbi:MAG: HD domain-containing protein [Candidatus Micrarchaeia archaeon]
MSLSVADKAEFRALRVVSAIRGFRRLFESRLLLEAEKKIADGLDRYWREAERMGSVTPMELVRFFKREFSEARMNYTPYHSRQVAKLAIFMTLELGLPPEEVFLHGAAGFLHDIGKLLIPKEVLKKELLLGKSLSNGEKRFLRQHAENGELMLSRFDCGELLVIRSDIRSHHERFDGLTTGPYAGYPDGLKGEAIPFGARLLKLPDSLSAMVFHRFYRNKVYSLEDAVAALVKLSGTEYDPGMVRTLVKTMYRIPGGELDEFMGEFAGKEFSSSIYDVFMANIRGFPRRRLKSLLNENGLKCSLLRARRDALQNAYRIREADIIGLLEAYGIEFDGGSMARFQKYINRDNRRLHEWEEKILSPAADPLIHRLYEELQLSEVALEMPAFTFLS